MSTPTDLQLLIQVQWLSRVLNNHIGQGREFEPPSGHNFFLLLFVNSLSFQLFF